MSGYLVAVDYGTVNTVAALRRPDGQVRPLLVDGSPLLPSAAYVGSDGRLLVGRDAENAGRVDPAAFVPDPGSRIDAGTVALGRSTLPVADVIGGTLARVVQEAIQAAGGMLPRLVLTHPGSWDETRRATLTEAGFRTGLGVPTLVPTPVAAAWYHRESVGDIGSGRCLLVYHLGAGTFEASLLRRAAEGFDLLAVNGLADVGGVDLDDLLIKLVGAALSPGAAETWQRLVAPTTAAELRQFAQLCEDVRLAKEALSRQHTVDVHIPLVDQDVHIKRETFESAAEPLLARTVDQAVDLLAAAGTSADQVGEVLLLGGSSRIPLVTTLLRRRFSLSPIACRQPELAVAEGALTAAGRTAGGPLGSTGPSMAAGEPPTLKLTLPVAHPAATSSVARSGLLRRPTRLLATAAGLALVIVIAGLFATRHSPHPAPDGGLAPTDPPPTATGQGTGVLATAPATGAPTVAASAGSLSTKATPTAPAMSATPPPPTTTAAPPPVAVSLTATPTSGTCATDVKFVAYFTVHDARKYRWHWVFGGPNNYSSTSGEHDRDKTGDVHITKKFSAGGSGIYWGQVQITSPITVRSNQASVQITCTR
ncbi:MAG TPA: Hsp70 family protein [Pilimelia sp.]|nr:Hsp70 family protein [Pilimelia sp.]